MALDVLRHVEGGVWPAEHTGFDSGESDVESLPLIVDSLQEGGCFRSRIVAVPFVLMDAYHQAQANKSHARLGPVAVGRLSDALPVPDMAGQGEAA